MALVVQNRVQESSTANTTVSFTLTGAVTGFQSFASIGNGNTTYYGATDASGSWEVGLGTYSTTGPTLTRTTILASSNSGSAVTFSGSVNVFVTYPSGQAVYSNGTNLVGPTNIPLQVSNGGTGVIASSGVNSVVLRDANGNVLFNNFTAGVAATTAAGGTTVLTVASARTQILVGSTTQTFQLPDATTLALGQSFIFVNNSSGVLTITNNASTVLDTIPSGGITQLGVVSIATSAGSWAIYSFLPGSYNFNNTTATFNNATISDAVWNGTVIAPTYGGTGLSSFGAANYALYSSSTSALTAGTLPVAAGGTGSPNLSANHVLLGNNTSALQVVAPGANGNVLTSNGTTWQSTAPAASGPTKAQAIAYAMTLGF
jgi:hypothetical protein